MNFVRERVRGSHALRAVADLTEVVWPDLVLGMRRKVSPEFHCSTEKRSFEHKKIGSIELSSFVTLPGPRRV